MSKQDEFGRAVEYLMGGSGDSSLIYSALSYLDSFKASPEGWKYCLNRLFVTGDNPQVSFVCIQCLMETVLHRYHGLNEDEKRFLHREITRWVIEFHPSAGAQLPTFALNKFATLYALVILQDYPVLWPKAFADLLAGLPRGGTWALDLFMRILTAVDDEIVAPTTSDQGERARGTEVKDVMREDCIKDITEVWHSILVTYANSSDASLVRAALFNISAFVDWIDIGLIANARFVPLFYRFLGPEFAAEIREVACLCLENLVNKGTGIPEKIALLNMLELDRVLGALTIPSGVVTFDIAVAKLAAKVCKVCNLVIDTGIKSAKNGTVTGAEEAFMHIEKMVPLLLRLAIHESDDVSRETFPALGAYGNRLARISGALSPAQSEFVMGACQVAFTKCRYPSLKVSMNQQANEEFVEYRAELTGIFRSFAKAGPACVKTFLLQAVTQVLDHVNEVSPADIEVMLHLVYAAPEAIPEHALKLDPEIFGTIITRIVTSPLHMCSNEAILLKYMAIVSRYSKFICSQPHLLQAVLMGFLGNYGIRHPIPGVRSKACSYFQKFVKDNRLAILPLLEDVLATLVLSLEIQPGTAFTDRLPSPSPDMRLMFTGLSPSLPPRDAGSSGGLLGAGGDAFSIGDPLLPAGKLSSDSMFSSPLMRGGGAGANSTSPGLGSGSGSAAAGSGNNGMKTGGSGKPPTGRTSVGGTGGSPYVNSKALNPQNPQPISNGPTVPSFEDQVLLFEAVGQLIGGDGLPAGDNRQQVYIQAVIEPLTSKIDQIIANPASVENADHVAQLIAALGYVTKGFNMTTCETAYGAGFLKRGLDACVSALKRYSAVPVVMSKCIFYLHRMVTCLGDELLQCVPEIIPLLFSSKSLKDVIEVVRLCNQVIVKFRGKAVPLWNALLIPSITSIFDVVQNGIPSIPEQLENEQRDLQCAYYTYLFTLLSNDASTVFVSPENASHLPSVLATVIEGATNGGNAVQKLSFSVMGKMVDLWAGDDNLTSGFRQYAFQTFIPICFSVPLAQRFDLEDAVNNITLSEIAVVHRTFLLKCTQAYTSYLIDAVFPSMNFPKETAIEFVNRLVASDVKFKSFLRPFIQELRKFLESANKSL